MSVPEVESFGTWPSEQSEGDLNVPVPRPKTVGIHAPKGNPFSQSRNLPFVGRQRQQEFAQALSPDAKHCAVYRE